MPLCWTQALQQRPDEMLNYIINVQLFNINFFLGGGSCKPSLLYIRILGECMHRATIDKSILEITIDPIIFHGNRNR